MEEPMEPFDELKFAALSKSKYISPLIKSLTLGPNKTLIQDEEQTITTTESPIKQKTSSKILLRCSQSNNSTNLLINQIRSEFEKQRHDKVKKAVSERVNCFIKFSEKQEADFKQQYEIQQQLLANKIQQEELMIVKTLEQHEKDTLVQHEQRVDYYKELAERKRKNDLQLQEKEQRKQQINLIIDRIKADQVEFRNVYQEISNVLRNCKNMHLLKAELGETIKQLKAMPEEMEDVVLQCKNQIISENDCMRTNKLVQDIKDIFEVIKQKILEVNIAEEKASQPPQTAQLTSRLSEPEQVPSTPVAVPLETSNVIPIDISKFVSKSSLKLYTELQIFLQTCDASLFDLINNATLKQFRFDCKKAVNMPINAISATNTEHLTDKYNRLSSLLSGRVVEVGGTRVCAASHPQGVLYSKNLLASNFVLQGDLMISSKPEAAFSYAAVIAALWNEHDDFGKLLLAHFNSLCPYLVPMYPPRTVGQTDEEFYRSQGYSYPDGVVEKQDKFLKRMSGTMRLYAALVIAHPKRGQSKNPLGCNEGWRWLAAFVNLEPKPDITATMLHIFLETAGFALEKVYGKSFMKLMKYICQVYLVEIQKIDSGGPVTRLEVLLQNYMMQGRFTAPNGMLPTNFW